MKYKPDKWESYQIVTSVEVILCELAIIDMVDYIYLEQYQAAGFFVD